jgi:hypothetical protein
VQLPLMSSCTSAVYDPLQYEIDLIILLVRNCAIVPANKWVRIDINLISFFSWDQFNIRR